MIDWSKISDNSEVIKLIKQKIEIEEKIRLLDYGALWRYAVEVLECKDEQQ